MAAEHGVVSAEEWFSGGERLPYDPERSRFDDSSPLRVFVRRTSGGGTTLTFLPGWPDGSFGWGKVDAQLAERSDADRLFLDYVRPGDSDKPLEHPYSTYERADLVEALWRARSIAATVVVAFDYSCIVSLELLARRIERQRAGEDPGTAIHTCLLANGGLFADGHTPVVHDAAVQVARRQTAHAGRATLKARVRSLLPAGVLPLLSRYHGRGPAGVSGDQPARRGPRTARHGSPSLTSTARTAHAGISRASHRRTTTSMKAVEHEVDPIRAAMRTRRRSARGPALPVTRTSGSLARSDDRLLVRRVLLGRREHQRPASGSRPVGGSRRPVTDFRSAGNESSGRGQVSQPGHLAVVGDAGAPGRRPSIADSLDQTTRSPASEGR
jgi:pimeloyl-ACP methyl ester carboxylesterase